jgi:hypothetical protein
VAGQSCGGCHDNGPFVRSPYLAQVTGANALPGSPNFLGTDALSFNKTQPYAFVGQEFASWKAFKVEIENNRCNDCHRMGVNNVWAGHGTALDFGLRATAECKPVPPGTTDTCEQSKNFHSPTSPIWMTPGQITFSADNRAAAQAIHDCATRLEEDPLPNTRTCKISKFAEEWVRPPPACPTGVRADTNLNRIETTFSWFTPPKIDHLFIRRNGHVGPSGLLVFSDGKSVLPPSMTTVTVPFDLAISDYLATYNVCTVADDAQSCCAAPITPTRSVCVEVAKCRVHGREVLATDTDDPQTWCADVGGKIDHFIECSTTGDGTTTTTTRIR